MNSKEIWAFFSALQELEKEKGIDRDYLIEKITNAIVIAVGSRSHSALSDTFKKLEQIWSDYKVFENVDG